MKYKVIDVETTTSNKGNPFDTKNKLCYVGIGTDMFPIEYGDAPYGECLNNIQKQIDEVDVLIGFNIKFDLHWLKKYGINFGDKRIWDCQLVHFVLGGQQNPYPSLNGVCEHYGLEKKLDEVSEVYWKNGVDTPDIPEDILREYLQKDLVLTEQVYLQQVEEVKKNPLLARLISLHNQDLLVLQEMEFNGLLFNQEWSEVLGNELEEQIDKLDRSLLQYHEFDNFNPNSVDHVSCLLYGGTIIYKRQVPVGHYKTGDRAGEVKHKWEEFKLELPRLVKPLRGTELVKEGYFSTDEKTLKTLTGSKRAKEVIELLLTRSLLEKRMSTYYKGLVNLIEEQNWKRNMIYGQLNQCVARTGRLSSSKPNLQNFDGEIKTLFYSRY
jgi:DNA polymerase I-like protein with 3'-5' exonuclease and polymerase domains